MQTQIENVLLTEVVMKNSFLKKLPISRVRSRKGTRAIFSQRRKVKRSGVSSLEFECVLNVMEFDWNWILYHDNDINKENFKVITWNWGWSKTRGSIWRISISWIWTNSWIITTPWKIVYRVGWRLIMWRSLIFKCFKVSIEGFCRWFWSRMKNPFSFVVCENNLKQSGWNFDSSYSISYIEVYSYYSDQLFV